MRNESSYNTPQAERAAHDGPPELLVIRCLIDAGLTHREALETLKKATSNIIRYTSINASPDDKLSDALHQSWCDQTSPTES